MWIAGVCLLTIATTTVAMDEACKKPPISDYESLIGCCKHSVITYTNDAMDDCKMYNTSSIPNNKDLILMNVCEIQCYLNNSGLVDADESVRQEQLVSFLRSNLQNDEVKVLLSKLTSKCLSEVEYMKNNKNFDANFQPYYASLIDCIQGEIFMNCPERLSNPSEKCAAARLFVKYCGMGGLRKMFGHPDADDEDSDEDSSLEYEDPDSDQSESESCESCENDSEDSGSEYSGSEYDSEYDSDYDSESESSGDESMELTTAVTGLEVDYGDDDKN